MRRVRAHPDFRADQAAQLQWLIERGETSWIENLIDGTKRVVATLATFPAVGSVVASRGSMTVRAIHYPKGPCIAWYLFDEDDPDGEVWVVRLFHERQERRESDIERWTRRS